MIEYRKLPHGGEKISTPGLGMGGIQAAPPEEIEAVIRRAMEHGINFFDLCAGGASVYEPFGKAIKGRRGDVVFQLHLGAVYNADGEYGWSRDLDTLRSVLNGSLKSSAPTMRISAFCTALTATTILRISKKRAFLTTPQSSKRQAECTILAFPRTRRPSQTDFLTRGFSI